MKFPYYKTDNPRLESVPDDLTLKPIDPTKKTRTYFAQPDLEAAVNVALLLGQPLLLTGAPGTGKTQLAHSINYKLGFKNPAPWSFETKSTSIARDLFYTYDAIGRFHAAQTAPKMDGLNEKDKQKILDEIHPANFISYNALGLAILLANDWNTARRYLPFFKENNPEEQFDKIIEKYKQFEFLKDTKPDQWQRRSVVLIDEIDKAPRDFPNDILNEIERMFFRISELNAEISVTEENYKNRPAVIMTSNSEKNLPEAFMRRCAYYHIEPPSKADLRKIVVKRVLPEFPEKLPAETEDWLEQALNIFEDVRHQNLDQTPATAELLGWITAIQSDEYKEEFKEFEGLSPEKKSEFIEVTLTLLTKNKEDRKKTSNKLSVNKYLKMQ